MTLKERYKRFKAWQINPYDWSFDENERHHCENCGHDFTGNFCPHCSQKAGLKKISWKNVLQSIGELWGMGNRSMLYSLWQLIWRPWQAASVVPTNEDADCHGDIKYPY